MGAVTVGLDVGQRIDPTALAVVDKPDDEDVFIVRYLERLTLGTPYPAVAKRIGEVCENLLARLAMAAATRLLTPVTDAMRKEAAASIWIVADATGVGTPVIELIREELKDTGIRLAPAFFTHGDKAHIRWGAYRDCSVGKAYLVSRLQSLIQTQRIRLPRTEEARVLAQELQDYEIRVDENANDKYGAFKVGTHDDLVTALGLATIVDRPTPRLARSYQG